MQAVHGIGVLNPAGDEIPAGGQDDRGESEQVAQGNVIRSIRVVGEILPGPRVAQPDLVLVVQPVLVERRVQASMIQRSKRGFEAAEYSGLGVPSGWAE